jgi:hypothetical protein
VRNRREYAAIKKTPQLRVMLQLLAEELVRVQRRFPLRPAVVCDVGGGRGDLALAVAASFPSVLVVMLDANEPSLAVGAARAAAAGLTNIDFRVLAVEGVANATDAAAVFTVIGKSVDIFIGLHACGGLSDAILGLALHARAAVVCAPCCYGKHSIMRGADTWWSALACGSVPAVVAPACPDETAAETPCAGRAASSLATSSACEITAADAKTLCCLAECTDRSISLRASVAIASLRLAAFERLASSVAALEESPLPVPPILVGVECAAASEAPLSQPAVGLKAQTLHPQLELRSFAESASLRNLVMVGRWVSVG